MTKLSTGLTAAQVDEDLLKAKELFEGKSPAQLIDSSDKADSAATSLNSVVWMGIDSLTAGSGGYSYVAQFEKFARGSVGWGGRWISFDNNNQLNETTLYKSGANVLSGLDWTDPRKQKSLSGSGFYAAAGANLTYSLAIKFDWTHADIYYLQQSGGGTITISSQSGQPTVTISTDGEESLQSYRYIKSRRNGIDSENNNLKFRSPTLDAEIVVFGAVFYSGDAGPVFVQAGQGGRKVSDHLNLDATYQSNWFNKLGITHAVVNGGMNDRTESTPSELLSDLTSLCSRFPSTVSQYIVRPNDPSDDLIAQYQITYESVASTYGTLLDTLAVYGNYSEFTARGWMLDGVHPNQDFQYHWAQYVCVRLFGSSRFEETPPIIDFTDLDSQLLRKDSFKYVLEVLDDYEARIAALEAL